MGIFFRPLFGIKYKKAEEQLLSYEQIFTRYKEKHPMISHEIIKYNTDGLYRIKIAFSSGVHLGVFYDSGTDEFITYAIDF